MRVSSWRYSRLPPGRPTPRRSTRCWRRTSSGRRRNGTWEASTTSATHLTWVRPPDNLDIEFDELELSDLGGGRIVSEAREVYRVRETGEEAYTRRRRIEVTIRDRRIARYEMRIVG